MVRLIALLSGSGGGWIALAIGLGLFAAGGGAGWTARGIWEAPKLSAAKLETAQCRQHNAEGRAKGAEATVAALQTGATNVTNALNTLAAKAAARAKSTDQFERDIANAPITHSCGSSAAELAFRRSLQPKP